MPTIYVPGVGYMDSSYAAGMGQPLPGMGYGGSYGQYGPGSSTMGNPLVSQQWADQSAMLGAVGGSGGGAGGAGGGGGGGGGSGAAENAAIQFLQSVLGGQKLPFDEATRANMLTQASDMNAAAETAQMQSGNDNAAAAGVSGQDPSLRARAQEFMARRQSANTGAAQGIASQANRANFGAQMQAAGTLADYALAQQDRQARAAMMAYQAINQGRPPSQGATQYAQQQSGGQQQQSGGFRPNGSIRPSGFGGLYGGASRPEGYRPQADPNAGMANTGSMWWNTPTYQQAAQNNPTPGAYWAGYNPRPSGSGGTYRPSGVTTDLGGGLSVYNSGYGR